MHPAQRRATGRPRQRPVSRAIDHLAQLQIFLDQQLFGPGKIDGRPGEFTTKALIRYQRAHGLPETGKLEAHIPLDLSLRRLHHLHDHARRPEVRGRLCRRSPRRRAKRSICPYESLLEFLTERFHCAPEFLE